MFWKTSSLIAAFALASFGYATADEMVLEQIYGSGVHAFNQSDYGAATTAFTAAIRGGTSDPRPYYFRALTYLRTGREADAKLDFEKGAELEAVDTANVTLVSRSMERVQGPMRQTLEQYRTLVRAAALERKETNDRAVRQAVAKQEQSVRRAIRPMELPSNPDAPPPTIPVPPSGKAPDENPFDQPAAAAAPPATREVQAPGVENTPAVSPPDTPAPNLPATRQMPKPNPPADDNPFGEPAPNAAPKSSNSDNPFGDTPNNPPPRTNGATSPGDRSAGGSAQTSPGGIGSLFHAFVEGSRSDEDASAAANGPGMEIPSFIHGILGGGPPPGGSPPGNAPMPADQTVPGNASIASPPATNPATPPTNPATQPPPTTPQPAAGTPQPPPTTPQPMPPGSNPFD